ncbi:hypothetical protein L1987_21058 [Smallanthus sonchifolius]|uniref:Uncharacterized protein n=1 Tax=Smallanthus sonchifolius TaxID=185202 RepID=A0ACB9IU23_9ASTR|nr:hypothetical protein L1987_21058 [Smallanthus sonchifolius]
MPAVVATGTTHAAAFDFRLPNSPPTPSESFPSYSLTLSLSVVGLPPTPVATTTCHIPHPDEVLREVTNRDDVQQDSDELGVCRAP